jgi:kynurenine formamidase/ketosteroid isomerase-like protein
VRVLYPIFVAGALACAHLAPAQEIDLRSSRIVDLTHSFNAETLYWPTSPSAFKLERLARGPTEGGYFYSANAFSTPEHGGTHLDAPIHFSERGQTTDQLSLGRLMGPAVVLDVSAQAAKDAGYRLTRDDVLAFERRHGRIPSGSIILLRTGWSSRWPDRKRYLGDDTPGDASRLRFPSFGADAARLLVEDRGAAALGADVASIDYGQSTDFMVHRIAAARNVPGLENLTNLNELPATGATVIALPMKIEGGSGGPVRVVALIPSSTTAAPTRDDEKDVLAAAAAIVDAFGRHDTERYFALFAPEASFVFHSTSRRLENLAAYREEWANWEKELGFRVRSCKSSDQKVQLFGDVAVFSHSVRTDLSTKDGETTMHERETIVFHRRNGKWIAVHEHLSLQPGPHDNTGP